MAFTFLREYTYFRMKRLIKKAAVALALCFLVYICLFAIFIEPMPDSQHRETTGFQYTSKASEYKKDFPNISDKELIESMGNDISQVYTHWSVRCIEMLLLAAWLSVVAALSFVFAVFTLYLSRMTGYQNRRQTASRRTAGIKTK